MSVARPAEWEDEEDLFGGSFPRLLTLIFPVEVFNSEAQCFGQVSIAREGSRMSLQAIYFPSWCLALPPVVSLSRPCGLRFYETRNLFASIV